MIRLDRPRPVPVPPRRSWDVAGAAGHRVDFAAQKFLVSALGDLGEGRADASSWSASSRSAMSIMVTVLPTLRSATTLLDPQRLVTNESGIAGVDGHVGALPSAVVQAILSDRIEATEYAVADVVPPHPMQRCIEVVGAGLTDPLGGVGGVGKHLGRDTAHVGYGCPLREPQSLALDGVAISGGWGRLSPDGGGTPGAWSWRPGSSGAVSKGLP